MRNTKCIIVYAILCISPCIQQQEESQSAWKELLPDDDSNCEHSPARKDKSIGYTLGHEWASSRPLSNVIGGLFERPGIIGRRRLPFMIPVMYNLGVVTTLLVVITVLMFKGLTIGVILLIISLGNKSKFGHTGILGTNRPIHIHLHGAAANKLGSQEYIYSPSGMSNRFDEEEYNGTVLNHILNPRDYSK